MAAVNADNRGAGDLPFTGERFVPGVQGEIWIEHWHRYHFARRLVSGKRVLDVACGEGYGSALLAREASHVTGVDLSQEAIDHARRTYGARENLEFACATCTRVPLPDASVDVVVTFETIEHIAEQTQFVDEIARVLRPDGVLVISCPNKIEYTDRRDYHNEFHVKELYRDELGKLVHNRFPASTWYGQRTSYFSVIAPEEAARAGQLVEVSAGRPDESSPVLNAPLYFVIVASRAREALAAMPPTLSVLSDLEEVLRKDHSRAHREVEQQDAHIHHLDALIAERDAFIAWLQRDLEARTEQAADLAREIEGRDATIALRDAAIAARDLAITLKAHEIDRRRGWRWWLRLPLIRLGWVKWE